MFWTVFSWTKFLYKWLFWELNIKKNFGWGDLCQKGVFTFCKLAEIFRFVYLLCPHSRNKISSRRRTFSKFFNTQADLRGNTRNVWQCLLLKYLKNYFSNLIICTVIIKTNSKSLYPSFYISMDVCQWFSKAWRCSLSCYIRTTIAG
jgi:hypothetical protein